MQKQIASSSSQSNEDEEILTPTEKSPNKLFTGLCYPDDVVIRI